MKNIFRIILFLILIAPLANPFEKGDANTIYFPKFSNKENYDNSIIRQFKFMNFKSDLNRHYEELIKTTNLVKSKCKKINKFYNL